MYCEQLHSVKWSELLYLVFLNSDGRAFCFVVFPNNDAKLKMLPCDVTSRDADLLRSVVFLLTAKLVKMSAGALMGYFFICG
jgi:hypothetical protein